MPLSTNLSLGIGSTLCIDLSYIQGSSASPGMESNIHTKAQRCASASSGKAQWWWWGRCWFCNRDKWVRRNEFGLVGGWVLQMVLLWANIQWVTLRSGQVPGSSVDEGLCPSLLLYTSNIYAIIQILMYCNIFHGCE